MIIVNDTCVIYVSKHWLVSPIMIVNVMPKFGASFADDSGVIIYNCNMFIIQAPRQKLLNQWPVL